LEGREPFRAVLDDACTTLGIAIANLAKILEVRTIFVGGYPVGLPESARARIFDTANAHLQPPLKVNFAIRYSRIPEAGLVGAAIPVIRRFLGVPATIQ
jgi:predicted NBD/HSP70 family sugar kinase